MKHRQPHPNPTTRDQELTPVSGAQKISVLLVDDHAHVLKILRYLVETTDDIQVVATASSGGEAITQASSYCPDVVVMDVSMPVLNGIEAARQILLLCPLARVLMLSILDSQEYIHRALDVGALGYILKEKASKELLTGIRTLFSGKPFLAKKLRELPKSIYVRREMMVGRLERGQQNYMAPRPFVLGPYKKHQRGRGIC